jgi:hypothetical protein
MVYAGVVVLGLLAIGRAAQFRFQDKEQTIRQACQAQLQKLGLTRDAAKARYPTPEIHMVSSGCLTPGATGDVVVKGKFAADTKFVLANDNLEVVKETLGGNEYRATVKVAPDIVPQTADVIAITPVSGITARSYAAIAIGGRIEWNLQSANGWTIVAHPSANKDCGSKPVQDVYSIEFFRKGESAPFQKLEARQEFSMYEGLSRFTITQPDPAMGSGMGDLQALMAKMSDPKLTPAERDRVLAQLQAMQGQMQAHMKKMTDPAYLKSLEEQKQNFGCERIELRMQAGKATGEMRCAEKTGTRIALTGSLRFLGR